MYMAVSANGLIARSDDDTSWVTQAEWASFCRAVRRAGCLVVGRRTYRILTAQPEFADIADVRVVAVAPRRLEVVRPHHRVAPSPRAALKLLADFNTVIVAGGGVLNASFLAENLVDELYLDIEPILLGRGIPLFKGEDFMRRLRLVGQMKISRNEIQLHYKVIKSRQARA